MSRFIFSLSILFLLSLGACKTESSESPDVVPEAVELPQDFLDFYEEFHADTLFQLNHISFPLSGKPASGQFSIDLTDFKWTREGWRIHKRIADDDDTF